MLMVHHGMVTMEYRTEEELLNDTRCVVSSFVKKCKDLKLSDELIEKTLIQMIADGFTDIDKNKMFDLTQELKDRME